MKKKKNKLFKIIFWMFFLSFTLIYFSEVTGYYEYKNYQKKAMTNEQIKQFENDVKNGKKVDLNKYVSIETIDYSNKLSSVANTVSNGISNIVRGSVENIFKLLENLVKD